MNAKVMGADQSVSNKSGDHWTAALQVTTSQSRLYKLSITAIVDCYVWFFDLAAGTATSANPIHVRAVSAGYADTWDFGEQGKIFKNGIYVLAATAMPADPTTAATSAGNDAVILSADVRVG